MAELSFLLFSNPTDRIILNILGVIVSLYSLYIEVKKAKQPNYRAMCDLSENVSCSRVLTSRYAKGFGIVGLLVGENSMMNLPNCVLGIVFYSVHLVAVAAMASGWMTCLAYYTAILANIGSVYLAYILFVILKDVCLLCMATYAINACILFLTHAAYIRS